MPPTVRLEGGPGAVDVAGLRGRLNAIVVALDADGDGTVTREEVAAAAATARGAAALAEADDVLLLAMLARDSAQALGFGRIVVPGKEVPIILANMI